MKKYIDCFLLVGDDKSYIVRCSYLKKFLSDNFANGLPCVSLDRTQVYETNRFKYLIVFHNTGDIVAHD